MSKKLPYYSKIKPQLSEPSVIDMEAGIYSYTVADKLIMEAEEKAKQEAKEAEKKQKEEEKKRLEEQQNKLEEEKKKFGGRKQSKPNKSAFIASLGLPFLL